MLKLPFLILMITFIVCSCSNVHPPTRSKEMDVKMRLHDIWALESIMGRQLNLGKGQKRPQLEINLTKMAISGNDGCNNFAGSINNIDSEKIQFGSIAVTRKACIDMSIPDNFHQHINNVEMYSINDLKLYLLDKQGNKLLRFQKVD